MPRLVALLACLLLTGRALGETTIHLSLVTDRIGRPVYGVSPPGDTERVFLLEQWADGGDTGYIRILRDGVILEPPFLALSPVATNSSTGVLCLAFPGDYDASGLFYVLYTDDAGTVVVSRFSVSARDPDVADPGSEHVLLSIPQPHHFHQGGWLGFGPDGYLYLSAGDGGPGGDPDRRGQDPGSLLGKMLRIDPAGDDFPADPSRNYAIPPDNPFVGLDPLDEIWAMGVREPWRCAFDRATGDLYIPDVGEEDWEELNVEPAGFAGGANYGWRCREGAHEFLDDPECAGATLTEPLYEYGHAGGHCCIVGGYVYRGAAIPALRGRYLFADHCTSTIRSARYEGGALTDVQEHCVVIDDPPGLELEPIASFGEDARGELLLMARFDQVFRIVPGCIADLDGDDAVGIADLLLLLASWGGGGGADLDGDGTVGISDLLSLLAAWGPCP